MKALIVEDHASTRRLFKKVLSSHGHEITACEDAETAWAAYQQEIFPLVILDLTLPGMDGLELCRKIRALPQGDNSLILVATGRSEPEMLKAVLDAGADDYMVKPVPIQLLTVRLIIAERQVRNLIERKRAEEALRKAHDELEMRVRERTAELARANEELGLARDRALEASRLKTHLLAAVSHESRTPLSAILGYADMLQEGVYGQLSDLQQDLIRRITTSARQMLGSMTDLLDRAQLESGTLELHITLFAPSKLLDAVQSAMSAPARDKGLELTAHIAEDVPAKVSGDLTRLHQVLENLVSNAINFTEQGKVHVEIYCPDPAHWALRVSDTGLGISAEAQAYVFDAFRQADGSPTRQHGGWGLGLSIVKELVTLMGGEVTLVSEVDQGSTFTVVLPIVLEEGEKAL